MFGVDEAGRGPVLGSMFIACVAVEAAADLPDGIKDSKRLSRDRIATLADRLRADPAIRTALVEVPTDDIDDPETNMTTLTVAAFADAIDDAAADGEDGLLDACHTDADAFNELVADQLASEVETTSEHGADGEHPVVGAASIIAKDARERHVDALSEEYGDIGSGYPSDPNTRAFLESYVADHGDLPGCARRSWKTSQDLLAEAGQAGLSDF